jgi:hypothetical protein
MANYSQLQVLILLLGHLNTPNFPLLTQFLLLLLTFIDATSYLPAHGMIMYSDIMSVRRMCYCYLVKCMALNTFHINCDPRVCIIVQVNTYLQS